MSKRRLAQDFFLFFVFLAVFISFVDSTLTQVSAQDDSPTLEGLTPTGTQAVVPEIPTVGPVSVSYPIHGQTLKGIINITGNIALEGWAAYELAFADAGTSTPSWFVFMTGENPLPDDGLLAAWDTTTLTDGDYTLRLRISGPDGDQDTYVYGLHINNYTPDTPLPTQTFTATITPTPSPVATATMTFTPLPTSTPYISPTPMLPNPAILYPNEIVFDLVRGALFTGMLFGIFGLFLNLRSSRK